MKPNANMWEWVTAGLGTAGVSHYFWALEK